MPLAGLVGHAERLMADGEADHARSLERPAGGALHGRRFGIGADPILATLADSTLAPTQLLRQFQTRIEQA